jgi:hypothetical protein
MAPGQWPLPNAQVAGKVRALPRALTIMAKARRQQRRHTVDQKRKKYKPED